jgi:hypothetical protein
MCVHVIIITPKVLCINSDILTPFNGLAPTIVVSLHFTYCLNYFMHIYISIPHFEKKYLLSCVLFFPHRLCAVYVSLYTYN